MALDLSTVDKPGAPVSFTYTWKDTVLYALGIGAKRSELEYLYEGRGPKVVPSFVVVPMFQPMLAALTTTGADLAMVVHGNQSFHMHGELAPSATLSTVAKVSGVYDMRKLAIVYLDTELKDGDRLVATLRTQIIVRGAGGFGGPMPPKEPKANEIPKDRAPDFRVEEATTPEQALLYRLSGDLNPLHADPDFAARVGFEQGPILHGLCTLGHGVRHVMAQGKGALTGFGITFRKPVWPGDTLVTEGWETEPGKIALQMKVKGRDEVVCNGAWATLSA